MSQVLVEIESAPEVSEPTPVTVDIAVNPDFTYAVTQSYISVGENQSVAITWQIQTLDLPDGCDVIFDCPGITFFGEGVASVEPVDQKTLTLSWTNDGSASRTSFFYRIHMVGSRPGVGGSIERFAISHDPTIHNDPPS